ncbi:MAG: TniQ family protein [Ktedonobacteraceae bacterium]
MAQHFEEIASPLLPIWDMSIPDIPPRSEFYSLAPLGLNSSLVESMTSYICRLAYEHHVEVGTLIQYSIAPVLGKRYIADDKSRSISSFLRYAGPINGNGTMASDWVGALEALTLRTDLALLTLLVGANALSQRDLLQPVRQWCSMCYDVWRRQDAIIYEPLLWSINGITVCPVHCQLLERCCPNCSSSLPWLTWCSRPGYCSSCGRWLGKTDDHSQVEEKDIYIAETVGGFLAHIPQLSLSIPRECVIQSLRDLMIATTGGNVAAFSRNLGLPKTTLWELVQGYFPPSLPFLLQLCYQFRLSLLQFLIGIEQHITPGASPLSQKQSQKRDLHRPFEREKVQKALEDILADQQSVPLSMREVARRLGYPVRTIKEYFPMHCREIACRCAEYRKQQGQFRKTHLRQRIYEAARIVYGQKLIPTYQRVGTVLNTPGCFREYEARCALLDIRSQLDGDTAGEHVAEMEGEYRRAEVMTYRF